MSMLWTSPSGRQAVVSPHGELDLATAPAVLAAIDEAAALPEVDAIVIDLAAVSFMDSTGVKCVVAATNALRGRDGHVVVCNASSTVSRLLTLLGIDRTVTLFIAPDPVPEPVALRPEPCG